MKRRYESPLIIKTVQVLIQQNLLAGSVVTKDTKIETAGQQVETKSFDATGFNSTWE